MLISNKTLFTGLFTDSNILNEVNGDGEDRAWFKRAL